MGLRDVIGCVYFSYPQKLENHLSSGRLDIYLGELKHTPVQQNFDTFLSRSFISSFYTLLRHYYLHAFRRQSYKI